MVKVLGSQRAWHVKKQVMAHLHHLDVHEGLHLTVEFTRRMVKNYRGVTFSHPSPEPEKYKVYRILIDAYLDEALQMKVLAHEVVHVKQYVKNELVVLDEKLVRWKGNTFPYLANNNRLMPWEREAHQEDQDLVRLALGYTLWQPCISESLDVCGIKGKTLYEYEYDIKQGVSSGSLP